MIFLFVGCATNPVGAFKLSATNLQQKKMQSREYSLVSEENILAASAALFQDMGYNIVEAETRLGVITATKEVDATNGAQVVTALVIAILGGGSSSIDDKQEFTSTIVVLPHGVTNTYTVRMTIQQITWNTDGRITSLGIVNSNKVYTVFFEKLSKSVFLEKNI